MVTLIEERKQVLSKIAELQNQLKQGSSKAAISCGLRKRELEQIEVRLRKSGVNLERLDQEETEKANRSGRTVYKFNNGKLIIEI